jgi:tellurite resistance protein
MAVPNLSEALAKVLIAEAWADGVITEDEQSVLDEIRGAIESQDYGILGRTGRLVKGALTRRSEALGDGTTREKYFTEYITRDVLQSHWHVTSDVADFITRVAVEEVDPDLDDLRLTREFIDMTTASDRAQFLDLLFAVANADGFVSEEEFVEIQRIGRNFMLSSQTVYEAKMKIPREQRAK